MNDLIINLTGEILETNFPVWKKDLLAQIEGIQRELRSDEDFALATDQAKGLKKAEDALKKAKQAAIEQAADIQELFAAIDEVSAKARETRLLLDRQIKKRKEEIKDEIVSSGVKKARALVDDQNEDFRLTDTIPFTDRGRFLEAIKGKRGIDGMEAGVLALIDRLKREVAGHAEAVDGRAKRLGRVDPKHKVLFQDRAALLGHTDGELEEIIAGRIKVFEEEQEASASGSAEPEAEGTEDEAPTEGEDETGKAEEKFAFRVILNLLASEGQAEAIHKEIQEAYAGREDVQSVELEREPGGGFKDSLF